MLNLPRVPKRLLTGDNWVVEINEANITPDITIAENSTHLPLLHLQFQHSYARAIGVATIFFGNADGGDSTERAGNKE